MRTLLATLGEIRRFEGWSGMWARSRARLFSRRRFGRWYIDLHDWTPHAPAGEAIEVRRGSLSELIRCRERSPEALTAEFYADRLHGARSFCLGLCEGQVAHISWLFTSADRTLLIRLGPGDVELNFVYTMPTYRGRGLMTLVQTEMLKNARREGMSRAYTHVATDNRASIRGVRRTGFRLAGIVTLTWLLGVPFVRFAPGVPE